MTNRFVARRPVAVPDQDAYEDCTEVYGTSDAEILEQLDATNTCISPGGHVWLRGACLHCGDPAP